MTRAGLSRAAASAIDRIVDAIAEDNRAAAVRWMRRVETALERIDAYPRLGHRREDLTDQDVRFYRVGSHLLVYRADGDRTVVIDVLHAARDVSAQLRDDPGDAP